MGDRRKAMEDLFSCNCNSVESVFVSRISLIGYQLGIIMLEPNLRNICQDGKQDSIL